MVGNGAVATFQKIWAEYLHAVMAPPLCPPIREPNLNSCLRQAGFLRQLLSGLQVRIVRVVKFPLKMFQLVGLERTATSSKLWTVIIRKSLRLQFFIRVGGNAVWGVVQLDVWQWWSCEGTVVKQAWDERIWLTLPHVAG